MSKYSTVIQVLSVESTPGKKPGPDGVLPTFYAARCVLFQDDGKTVNTVGRLRIPKPLVPIVKEGMFTASFALTVPDYGNDKGDVVSQLTSLIPINAISATNTIADKDQKSSK
jgi:hypothetical protein